VLAKEQPLDYMNPAALLRRQQMSFFPTSKREHSVAIKRSFAAAIVSAVLFSGAALAQIPTSSLAGTVQDSTGNVIANANVVLVNAASGDTRNGLTNGSGYFTFTSLPSGDYNLTISAAGFGKFVQKDVHLDPGDSRAFNQIHLGASAVEVVTVTSDAARIDTTSGEISSLITASDIQHLAVEGRDVTELFKILPGFANANQGINNTAYDPSQVSVNAAIGSYAANGNPLNGVSMKWDGANITDPGNYGAAIQNVNYDMVSEVKVQISNFGADLSNGPVVISAVTKAGGSRFHGDLYTYARTSQLNATDALAKELKYTKPPDRYVYPGFDIGGPVTLPGTNFNRNGRVTFFAGAEDYAQRNNYAYGNPSAAIVHALVPTANMRNGNFSATELQAYLGSNYGSSNYQNITNIPTLAKNGAALVNGQIPTNQIDPGGQALLKFLPLPNIASTGTYNYITQNLINNNMYQYLGRVDVAISDKYKFFARYSGEKGASGVPQVPYYSPSSGMGAINTPGGGLLNTSNSQSAAANLTMILAPTLTNEVFGAFSYLNSGFAASNNTALQASTNGYPYAGAYSKNGSTAIPQLQDYGNDGLPLALIPDLSYGPIFSHKFAPNGGDNLTKVFGTHTLKVGAYVERVTNNQRQPFGTTNGAISQYYIGPTVTDSSGTYTTSGNYLANLLEGITGSYSQQNLLPDVNLYFWNVDFYANDTWKIRNNLTINYGLRLEHLGTWNDGHGLGIAVFNPATVNLPASQVTGNQPGLTWHAINSSIPVSGISSRAFFYEPRLGFSWDVTGKGQTVVRGGYGQYRYHDSWNDVANAVDPTVGLKSTSVSGNGGISLLAISQQNLAQTAGGISKSTFALTPGDDQTSLTSTYSLSIDQVLPHRTQFEFAYIGNNSNYLLNAGSNQTANLADVNALPIGALYNPSNPNNGGVVPTPQKVQLFSAGQINSFRNYPGTVATNNPGDYETTNGDFLVPKHIATANYNALQMTVARQQGPLRYGVNYTFSKALGILGADGTGNPIDPTNLAANYSIVAFDRTHIFNANYSFDIGNPVKNRYLGLLGNGWEFAGITQLQSGQDLPIAQNNPNFGLGGTLGTSQPTISQIAVTNLSLLGTPDVVLLPRYTCNPASGLSKGQFVNPKCYTLAAIGTNGQTPPYLHGPWFFASDLSAQKAFGLGEGRSLRFRVAAFNFLNHPLTTFNGADNPGINSLQITNTQASVAGAAPASPLFGTATYETGRRIVELSAKFSF
jgi:hypothetical protein